MKAVLTLQLRRTFLNRRFLILWTAAVILSWASVYFVQNLGDTFGGITDELLENFRQGQYYNLGMLQVDSAAALSDLHWKPLLRCILNSLSMTSVLAVGITLRITREFRCGGFFTAVAKGYDRRKLYAAYVLSMLLLTLVLSVTYLAVFVAAASLSGIPAGELPAAQAVPLLLTELVMLMSFSVFCTTLAVLLRQEIASVLTALAVVTALPAAFSYLRILYPDAPDLAPYWVLSRLSELAGRMPSAGDLLSAAGLTGVSIFAGVLCLDHIHIKND